ncbi:MAG TPA: secretin N-terminal domain-containing protein [Steroidobacteraceae bacterium]|nr:secretin N-terminal domain-containing protein [Steroidobacteraceae bacterium]
MRTSIRTTTLAALTLLTLVAPPSAGAQSEGMSDKSTPVAREGTVSLERLIAAVAKRTGKKFIVDPRARADDIAVVGQEPTSVDYATLLMILRVHGFAAVEQGGYVQLIPDANVRQMPLPSATGKESYAEGEFVNRLIVVKNSPAVQLVPLLRPLLPQYAHLVAFPCKNTLLLVDSFANVKRIEQIVRALDTGEPYTPPACAAEKPSG